MLKKSDFPKLIFKTLGRRAKIEEKQNPNKPQTAYIPTGFCGFQLEKKKIATSEMEHSQHYIEEQGRSKVLDKSEQGSQAQM